MLPRKYNIGLTIGLILISVSLSNVIADNVSPRELQYNCYQCEGDCEDAKLAECVSVTDKPQCYLLFDEEDNDLTGMGCASDFDEEKTIELIKQKLLYLCEGDKCNFFDQIPAPTNCAKCSSDVLENCATRPTNGAHRDLCQIVPYTQCYQRVNDGGVTERGCLSELEGDEFYDCLTNANGKCKSCSTDSCNEEIVPADRLKCERCNSDTDSNCHSIPSALSVCPKYNETDLCVAVYENGVTKRGCQSEFTCDASSRLCQICSGDGCNTFDLKKRSEEHYGLFQQLPLNCYTCTGSECLSGLGKVQKCSGAIEQDCVTAFDADGQVVARGCELNLGEEYSQHCARHPELCFNCKSNGCNRAQQQSDFIDCLHCDGQTNADCIVAVDGIDGSRKCYKSCATMLYPRNAEAVTPAYELIRSCLDDMDLDDREECEAGKNENCKACSSSKCNTDVVGERKSCYQCSGDDCQDAKASPCRSVMDNDQCFVQFDERGEIVQQGCKSQYDEDEVHLLVVAKRLWLCDDDDCNAIENLPKTQRCSICNSRTDPNCAIAPQNVVSDTACATEPFTQCYSRILDDGHTERGCLSSLENEVFYDCLVGANSTGCLSCVGDSCNQKIFPEEGRRSCHICTSETSDSCETAPQSSQLCVKHFADDTCVTLINGDGFTNRGCGSDLSCDSADATTCQICTGDDCNTSNLRRKADGKPGKWQDLPLQCVACTTENNCASTSLPTLEICEGADYCMTVFNDEGAVIRRGCSTGVESVLGSYCDANSQNCHNCNSNRCNTAENQADYVECVYCDSESNANCVAHPESVGNRRKCNKNCMTALYPRAAGSSVYELTRGCLDDKDDSDRLECLEGSDHCSACSEAACNDVKFPADRLSCIGCKGESCEDPQADLCSAYKDNDQCFILFDGQSNVQQMGCVSDLDDGFVSSNSHLMFRCDGDNCNNFGNLPEPNTCIACSSDSNPECAVDPANVPSVNQCSSLPNTQCFTRVTSDGITQRGCVSTLSSAQIRSCLSGTADCVTCTDNRCNVEVFPPNRRSCHRCNSKEDPSCESSPNAASICPVYTADEYCSTKLVNGYTYRGCSSEFQCDETDKQFCRMCSGRDNCNTADLASSNIGYPGHWQALPINCHTCLGAECHDGGLGPVRKCENNNLQNCGVVFAANGTVMQRGCSDEVYNNDYAAYCDEFPSFCKFCKSNGCNTAQDLNDYVDCLFCDGAQDQMCIFNPEIITHTRSCHKKCVTGLYPRTDEPNSALELTRSCLDDLDLDDRESCESGNKPHCKACEGPECNVDTIPETRAKCYRCEGAGCEEPEADVPCPAFRENDQCFIKFGGNDGNDVVRMGCASDLDNSDLVANRRNLILCSGDNCNDFSLIPPFVACSICSSDDDPNCAIDPSSPGVAAVCDILPYTSCHTHVRGGVTYRGCLSDVPDDIFDDCTSGNSSTCVVCDSNNCNTEIYPPNRPQCNRCDSGDDASCADKPLEFASICPVYKENDSCVTKIDENRLLRGCSSDFTCDANDRRNCRICDSSDNCNTVNLLLTDIGSPGKWQGLPLNCHTCEGASCASGAVIRKCEGNNLQTCVTVFDASGNVEKRGCSDAVDSTHSTYCDDNADKCIACKSNGCNNLKSLDELIDCYFCDSAESKSCSIDFSSVTRTRKCHGACMVALYPRSSAADSAFELSRSCLNDMDIDDRDACLAGDKENCVACEGSRCNTATVPEERHECYVCEDEDCEDVVTQQCSAYHPKDQCYILYNAENSIAGMGCRSDFETDAVTALIKQKRIILCEGKNCNTLDSAPTPKMCSVCNSEIDPRCATNPNLVENIERCSALPYTECFTRINERGHTERGCISSLDSDDFYGCLTETDGLCSLCVGDKCNEIDVYPPNRWKCHQCSSASDPACSDSPNSNTICPIYAQNDTCVTSLQNGVTRRGCGSSMKCSNENDHRTCRICDKAGCNTIDLEKASEEGEPGRWQELPITCLTCKGEANCASADYRVCEGNIYQSCMTVFGETGAVIQRGCSDTVQADNNVYCNTNTGNCHRCHSNGCNVATSLDDFVECLACDSDANGNCVSDVAAVSKTRLCHKNCMTALYPRFDEENPSYGMSRSCLDDMEMDDRDACAAGAKEHCQVCNTPKCNAAALPEKRLSCNICDGDDCQDPKETVCPTYRPDDQCYIRWDEFNSISAMGCRSEFSNAVGDYLLSQKRLHLCSGDNCNTFDNLPTAQSCALCNSHTDPNCATNPESVTSQTSCATLPITQCYARVLANGATERGCLSNLNDDEFLGCLNGTSATCLSCTGSNCNNGVFPVGRRSCHICDSSSNPSCAAKPNSLGICPLYAPDDTCVTAFKNDVTYRGCSSSLECDSGSAKTCSKCAGDGCNTINLAKKQDDNFGKWQDLPLKCLSCSGNECNSEANTKSLTCENNNEQDCVTVFDESGKVTRRGCSDIVEAEYDAYCDENEDKCYNCKSNDCNSAKTQTEFIDCVYCDSYKDVNCLWNPTSEEFKTRKCQGHCMTALYPSDSSDDPSHDLIRTCLNDKESANQTACASGEDENCNACADGKCNVIDLPADRLSCYMCNGDECEEPSMQLCPLYKQNDRCFIWFDESNSVNQMGCVSSFRNQDLETIVKTKRVFVCEGANCNALNNLPSAQKCAICDSKDDVSCATNALLIGTFNTCNQMPYTHCYSKVTSGGQTVRGCVNDLPSNEFAACVLGSDENCGICAGDGCNREVFPADRQQCFSCSSNEESDCDSLPTNATPCPIYGPTESCVTALSGNVTHRGCQSELLCDATDSKTCRFCQGTGCNSIDLLHKVDDGYHGVWQNLPLRCHKCSGEDCRYSLGPAVTCSRNVEQDCMTVFNADGEIRRRGCSDDVEDYEDLYCRQNPELCFKCKSNECNMAWQLTEYVKCSFCNSTADPLCAVNPENAGFATRSCYKECMVAMKGNELVRSCLDDKEIAVQYVCRANESGKECSSCEGNDCNKFVYPADRLKCHVCTGSTCSGTTAQYCQLYDENDFCFAKYENGRVDIMGCGTSQNSSDIDEWAAQKKLFRCSGNECNDLSKLPSSGTCLACDSSRTPECAQSPSDITTTESCPAPNGECVTRLNNGDTIRGCLSHLDSSESSTCVGSGTCSVCSGSRCNNQIFPANRRKCHICNSLRDEKCVKEPDSLQICTKYQANDRCVAQREDDFVKRGCASDFTCDANDQHCEICDSDGCNTADMSAAGWLQASVVMTVLLAVVATLGINH